MLTRVAAVIAFSFSASVIGGHLLAQAPSNAKSTPANGSTWTAPKMPDGHPDLQGVWDYRTVTPLERNRVALNFTVDEGQVGLLKVGNVKGTMSH